MSQDTPHRRSRWIVAFALIASLLVITAAPVSASHSAVVSEHTSDTDFSAGTVTGGMYINGTGDSAVVELDSNTTETFSYTGSEQTWTVPTGITSVTVELRGAGGGDARSAGGDGGYVKGTLSVTGGETLRIYVGGEGGRPDGGFNGGGDGGQSGGATAGGGGGASDIRQGGSTLSDRVAVAAGGGGGGDANGNGQGEGSTGGGAGGPDTGQNAGDTNNAHGGHGGDQSSGGAGGQFGSTDGSLGTGGTGGANSGDDGDGTGGGGGAGYYGGGGGGQITTAGAHGAGGGGGSNYDDGLSVVDANERGTGNSGNGEVVISYETSDTATYISANHTVEDSVGGEVQITEIVNGSVTVTWEGWDGSSWTQLDQTAGITTTGVKDSTWTTFTASNKVRVNVSVINDTATGAPDFRMANEGVKAESKAPVLDNSSASPTGTTQSASVTLEIPVSDADFGKAQADQVQVEFFVDGASVGTDTLTANGTASVTTTLNEGGEKAWSATATDNQGHSVDSEQFSLSVPSVVQIREESENHTLVTGATADIWILGDNETTDRQQISDGNVSLEGLPVDETYVVLVDSSDHHLRAVIVEDIFDQSTVFVLNTTHVSSEVTFEFDDLTGEFPSDETHVLLEKPVNRSLYDSEAAEKYQWTTIGGDRLGADAEYTIHLKKKDKYRLIIENEDGDRRVLGEYTGQENGTEPITIGEVQIQPQEGETFYGQAWVDRVNEGEKTVRFAYIDEAALTTYLNVSIRERGNESNVLYEANETTTGNFSSYTFSQSVTGADANATWIVEVDVGRNGEEFALNERVGFVEQQAPWPKGGQLLTGIILVFLLAFLAAHPDRIAHLGAIAVIVMSGVLISMGWAQISVSAWLVAAALAGMLYIVRGQNPRY